jgi:hypothetical protein
MPHFSLAQPVAARLDSQPTPCGLLRSTKCDRDGLVAEAAGSTLRCSFVPDLCFAWNILVSQVFPFQLHDGKQSIGSSFGLEQSKRPSSGF